MPQKVQSATDTKRVMDIVWCRFYICITQHNSEGLNWLLSSWVKDRKEAKYAGQLLPRITVYYSHNPELLHFSNNLPPSQPQRTTTQWELRWTEGTAPSTKLGKPVDAKTMRWTTYGAFYNKHMNTLPWYQVSPVAHLAKHHLMVTYPGCWLLNSTILKSLLDLKMSEADILHAHNTHLWLQLYRQKNPSVQMMGSPS